LGAVALPELKGCVRGCVDRRRGTVQAQAEGACRKECHESCLAHCDREVGERPLEFKKSCREDCDAQLDRL
jgi:hypothetical protein